MAETPLRQAKNLFIGTITKIGMLAAIPAGLDVELTYQLLDSYTMDCERASTIPEIDRLHMTAAMDFCRRISETHIPNDVSREVHACMCYIHNHINVSISLDDVAASIGRSVSYTGNLFKKENWENAGHLHCGVPLGRGPEPFALYRNDASGNQQLSVLFQPKLFPERFQKRIWCYPDAIS